MLEWERKLDVYNTAGSCIVGNKSSSKQSSCMLHSLSLFSIVGLVQLGWGCLEAVIMDFSDDSPIYSCSSWTLKHFILCFLKM